MSIIEYKMMSDVGIKFVTSVISNGKKKNIYKYITGDSDKYFHLENDVKYIGYIENEIFTIVSLHDDTFDETFKDNFSFIDKKVIDFLQKQLDQKSRIKWLGSTKTPQGKDIFEQFNSIPHFKYLYIKRMTCPPLINLQEARDKIAELNGILGCIDLQIRIDYVFQLEENTEINTFLDLFDSTTLLLCIFDNNNCISSLTLHISNEEVSEIYFNSQTKKEHQGKKLNKLLSAIIIIIAKYVYPSARYVSLAPINPIAFYLMIKYFNAILFHGDGSSENITFKNYAVAEEYFNSNEVSLLKTELNETNIQNAESMFTDIVDNEINCTRKSHTISSKKSAGTRRREARKKRQSWRTRKINTLKMSARRFISGLFRSRKIKPE
jgi:hypothetical protein